jgi:hypothetical protein
MQEKKKKRERERCELLYGKEFSLLFMHSDDLWWKWKHFTCHQTKHNQNKDLLIMRSFVLGITKAISSVSLSLSLSLWRERERGFSARFSILVFVYRKLVGSKPKAKYIHVEIELDSCWRPYLLVWTHENVELWERERERERVKSFGHAESAETFVVQNILWEEYTLE